MRSFENKGRRIRLVYHVHIKRAPDISDKLSLYKAYTIMIIPFFNFFFLHQSNANLEFALDFRFWSTIKSPKNK